MFNLDKAINSHTSMHDKEHSTMYWTQKHISSVKLMVFSITDALYNTYYKTN